MPAPEPNPPKLEGKSTDISAFSADEAVCSLPSYPECFPVIGLVSPDGVNSFLLTLGVVSSYSMRLFNLALFIEVKFSLLVWLILFQF